MDYLQDECEDRLIEVISVYNIKGIPVHEQISILSYLCFELCNRTFVDPRLGYTHMLTMIMQRIVFDMDDSQEDIKRILH
jgi:hypothetical protein